MPLLLHPEHHAAVTLPGVAAMEPRPHRPTILIEISILIIALVGIGFWIVPSHWTSIWMDREFTGWVAPLANRLGAGLVLYGDHGHIPMPPLPFILLYLTTGGHATWLSESICNFTLQSLTLLTMYFCLRRLWHGPVAFLATFASMPIFFSLPKTICYDALAQSEVALVALGMLWHLQKPPSGDETEFNGEDEASDGISPLSLFLLALATALCLLTKQSTGMGAFVGAVAALWIGTTHSIRSKVRDTLAYVVATGIISILLVFALSAWIDPSGFVHDVFLIGSEPKGGAARCLKNLAAYALQIATQGLPAACVLAVGFGTLRRITSRTESAAESRLAATCRGARRRASLRVAAKRAIVLAPLVPIPLVLIPLVLLPPSGFIWRMVSMPARQFLWAGLLLGLLILARRLLRSTDARTRLRAALFAVLFMSALFHSLSVPRFRWTYDNNPLIVLAVALVFGALLDNLPALPRRERGVLVWAIVFALQAATWVTLYPQVAACRTCTEAWPEVTYLNGAKLPTSAEGMRQLVAMVRTLTPAADDTVLLLPNDPNVEAWFDRPRPRLAAPILFADQYWDRLVDGDLATLKTELPKVIVIGPRDYWPQFQSLWQTNYGTARLIEAVQRDLLPAHYCRHASVPIQYRGGVDAMDVFVRK